MERSNNICTIKGLGCRAVVSKNVQHVWGSVVSPQNTGQDGRHSDDTLSRPGSVLIKKKRLNWKESQSFINYLEILLRKKKRVGLRSWKLGFSIRAHKGRRVWSHRDLKQSRYIIVHEEKQVKHPGAFPESLFNWLQLLSLQWSLRDVGIPHPTPLGTGDGTQGRSYALWEALNQSFISRPLKRWFYLHSPNLSSRSRQHSYSQTCLTTAGSRWGER